MEGRRRGVVSVDIIRVLFFLGLLLALVLAVGGDV
jgi:hypothetical protein